MSLSRKKRTWGEPARFSMASWVYTGGFIVSSKGSSASFALFGDILFLQLYDTLFAER